MPRYAVVDNGVVVGVLQASTPPTLNVPARRVFVDASELPDIRGGELWDGFMFSPASVAPDLTARVSKVEADVALLKTKVPIPEVLSEEVTPAAAVVRATPRGRPARTGAAHQRPQPAGKNRR